LVSNDIVRGRDADNLDAHVVTQKEGTVNAAESMGSEGVLATFAQPSFAGCAVGFNLNYRIGIIQR
jgi:hypothetical protein